MPFNQTDLLNNLKQDTLNLRPKFHHTLLDVAAAQQSGYCTDRLYICMDAVQAYRYCNPRAYDINKVITCYRFWIKRHTTSRRLDVSVCRYEGRVSALGDSLHKRDVEAAQNAASSDAFLHTQHGQTFCKYRAVMLWSLLASANTVLGATVKKTQKCAY